MAEDPASDGPPAGGRGTPDDGVLARAAAQRGLSEEELLERLLAPTDGSDPDGGTAADDDRVDAIDEELDALAERTDALADEFQAKIEDVRERVIQVKREADGKAPADHRHPEQDRRIEELTTRVESTLDEVEEQVVGGFENYETVLNHLTDATDELEHKLDVLGGAVLSLRERVDALSEERTGAAAVRQLAADANRSGVRRAECASCGSTVDIALLTRPACPHCDASFSDLEPGRGLFRSSVLATGTPPALEGAAGDGEEDADLDAVFEDDGFEDEGSTGDSDDRPLGGASDGSGSAGEGSSDESGVDGGGEVPEVTADGPPETAAGEDGSVGGNDGTPQGGNGTAPAEGDGSARRAVATELEAVDGIGAAYADRLRDAGVGTADDLAAADPDALAGRVEISEKRLARWIDDAARRTTDP